MNSFDMGNRIFNWRTPSVKVGADPAYRTSASGPDDDPINTLTGNMGASKEVEDTCPVFRSPFHNPVPIANRLMTDPCGAGLTSVLIEPSWLMAAAYTLSTVRMSGSKGTACSGNICEVPAVLMTCITVTPLPAISYGT